MGIQDRDYMKRRPSDAEPEDRRHSFSTSNGEDDARTAKLNKRVTTIFASIVIGAIVVSRS